MFNRFRTLKKASFHANMQEYLSQHLDIIFSIGCSNTKMRAHLLFSGSTVVLVPAACLLFSLRMDRCVCLKAQVVMTTNSMQPLKVGQMITQWFTSISRSEQVSPLEIATLPACKMAHLNLYLSCWLFIGCIQSYKRMTYTWLVKATLASTARCLRSIY